MSKNGRYGVLRKAVTRPRNGRTRKLTRPIQVGHVGSRISKIWISSWSRAHLSGWFSKKKQVKPGFTNYQPQPKYSWALSKIEGKGKLGKTKDLWKRSEKLNNSENLEVSENMKALKICENQTSYESVQVLTLPWEGSRLIMIIQTILHKSTTVCVSFKSGSPYYALAYTLIFSAPIYSKGKLTRNSHMDLVRRCYNGFASPILMALPKPLLIWVWFCDLI